MRPGRRRTAASGTRLRVGVLLAVGSILPYLALLTLPALGLSLRAAAAAAALVIVGEAMFWLGLALAGREAWAVARGHGWGRVPIELWRMLRTGRAA